MTLTGTVRLAVVDDVNHRRRILEELGLLPPDVESLRGLPAADFRNVIHARGRRLLAKYHPDHNPGDVEALELFRVAAHVIREAEVFEIPTTVRVTLYPESCPGGSHLYTRRAWRGYFPEVETSGLRYDARRVVLVRP